MVGYQNILLDTHDVKGCDRILETSLYVSIYDLHAISGKVDGAKSLIELQFKVHKKMLTLQEKSVWKTPWERKPVSTVPENLS